MNKEKTASTIEASLQIVTFFVGQEEYGLDIHSVTEVVRPLKITRLPKMPEFIEGVINLRGVIIPVVDLRKRFELSDVREDSRKIRMLITRGAMPHAGGAPPRAPNLLGLIIDSVGEVLHLPTKDIDAAPEAATGQHAYFISGVGKMSNRLVILIDIAKILTNQERTALAEAGDVKL